MARTGKYYDVKVKKAHLGWGTYRHTSSRKRRKGEAYIKIPAKYARSLQLLNQNGTGHQDIPGKNIFNCTSKDNTYSGILKAQGCKARGDKYAKQFSEKENLKGLGKWYKAMNASVGDIVRVTFISETDVCIELLKK